MEQLNEIIAQIDDFVWGPVMLVILLVLQLLWYLVVRELLYGCGFRQRLA